MFNCNDARKDVELYTEDFLLTFEKSDFYSTCKNEVEGKLIWNDWGKCSLSCGGGIKLRTARRCTPEYAHCYELPIKEEPCNDQVCPEFPSTFFPPGTIISWVPKPNANAPDKISFDDDTWIECDGRTTCKTGRFTGQACADLRNRVLVGDGQYGVNSLRPASLPNHYHHHTHSGDLSGTYYAGDSNSRDHCGMGGTYCAKPHGHGAHKKIQIDMEKMTSASISNHTMKIEGNTIKDLYNDLFSAHMRVKFMFKCY